VRTAINRLKSRGWSPTVENKGPEEVDGGVFDILQKDGWTTTMGGGVVPSEMKAVVHPFKGVLVFDSMCEQLPHTDAPSTLP
jgi:hypothetical protein